MELELVSAFLKDRKTYELFERIGNIDDFSPIARSVVACVDGYYRLDPQARSCSKDIVEARLIGAVRNPKHELPIKEFLGKLREDVSLSNAEYDIRGLHRRAVGQKLCLALANGQSEEEVSKLHAEYGKGLTAASSDTSTELVDALDTTDLLEEKSDVEYIKLWPKQLNDKLDGGVLRGHHVLLFARPETGKTLFSINLVAGFLHQGLSVLYVGNEEPIADVRDRIRGRLLKCSKQEIRARRSEAAERLSRTNLGRITITQETSFGAVRACLAGKQNQIGDEVQQPRASYDVVILDQVRNMRIKSDGRTAELEAAGIEARAIAKEFNVLVVSVTQAGDSATNKVYLSMSDVDSSKTGIPASADLMIGLGSDESMKLNGLIGISLPKNKLSGLHDNFTVSCNFQTGEVI